MYKIKLDSHEIDEWAKRYAYRVAARREFFQKVGAEGVGRLRGKAQEISATGSLQNSMDSEVTLNSVKMVSHVPYAIEALETGTPSGTEVNLLAIKKWVAIRGLPDWAAFPIKRNIEESGSAKWGRDGGEEITEVKQTLVDEVIPGLLHEVAHKYST